jgi:phenylalanyl-tRNA synthetase beta chain
MKVSVKWIKDYVDTTLSDAELAQKLTMAGLEVKEIQVIGEHWANIFVGQIVAVNPHPNADRLRLVTIDLATEQVTVVCGAPNCQVNDKIAFARAGADVISETGQLARLRTVKIRGTESSGMICSERELGISENHAGIVVLPTDAPVGKPMADYLGDTIFNLEVTPNRADCLSVIGIAREIAALTGQKLRLPEIHYEETQQPVEKAVAVEIKATDLCPRYCAGLVNNVTIGDSPTWMQSRLIASGMRPINNVVDITNYVMLEYGQPLHAFDYSLLKGKKIVVRRAEKGEKITTLDGVERQLSADTLVIADTQRAVAVAGVMGGANSEVMAGTTSVLLEAASFNPASIHYTGRTLCAQSEACTRFERGITAATALPALRRAIQLMAELAGGQAAKGWVDIYPGKKDTKALITSTAEVKRILGIEFSLDQINQNLTALGFECKPGQGPGEIEVLPPWWRGDIRYPVDLVEEVVRIAGYDTVPMTMLSRPIPPHNPDEMFALKRKIRSRLAGYGFQEILTYSLTSMDLLKKLSEDAPSIPGLMKLFNPMTAEQEYLRPNLRAGLLAAIASNRKVEADGLRLFEIGRVYISRSNDLPDERETLCGVLSGSRQEQSWHGNNKPFDFFDAKGVIEGLMGHFGLAATFAASSDTSLHTTRQAAVIVAGKNIGIVGQYHPIVTENFEVSGDTFIFEIDLAALQPLATALRLFKPIPRFPAVVRDVALVVGTEATHQRMLDVIKGFPLITDVALFDMYSGDQVPKGKKSLAYHITFQSPVQTLTDDDVNGVIKQILDKLAADFGAVLR